MSAYNPDFSDTFSDIFIRALDSLSSNPESSRFAGTFVPVVKDIATCAVGGGYATVDVVEYDTCFKLYFDVPGTMKSDIKLDLTKNGKDYVLKMVVNRKNTCNGGRITKRERFFGTKTREVVLPSDVDAGSVSAKHEDGILVVTVGRAKNESPSKSIPIA